MENLIWLIIMIPCSAILTGIGIYAWHREKPMWFWTGSEVKASEIADIPRLVEAALAQAPGTKDPDLEAILAVDAAARQSVAVAARGIVR